MKIITGTAKGMNLETLQGEATRPTSQRVKEAVFSMIQFDIEGACVLDLFAGSGQMGLEALSRGAKKAVFSDISRDATEIVMKNAKKARLFDKCRISTCDYKQTITGIKGKEKFDIVFIDPPYHDDCIVDAIRRLVEADALSNGAFVICESGKPLTIDESSDIGCKLEVYKSARYSISYVTVFRPVVE